MQYRVVFLLFFFWEGYFDMRFGYRDEKEVMGFDVCYAESHVDPKSLDFQLCNTAAIQIKSPASCLR
jgi:hypothetical protein